MPSSATPGWRQPIGQLLVHHLRFFRERLLADAEQEAARAGVRLRMAHLHVFGNISADGTRLTELASWAGMGLPAMVELVDELQKQGLVVRRADPTDRRAKLVTLTPAGWEAIRVGRSLIARIEEDYAQRLGTDRYEDLCWALQDLLEDLAGAPMRRAADPPQQVAHWRDEA